MCYISIESEVDMAKKPIQFRFEENTHKVLQDISTETGNSVSEIIRNAISLYVAIHERTKDGNARLYIKDKKENSTEIILP